MSAALRERAPKRSTLWLLLCALLACSDRPSASIADQSDAATGAQPSMPGTADAGASGQGTTRAGTLAADSGSGSAAMSGSGGASAGSGAAGMRASAGSVAPVDAGTRDAGESDAQTAAPACGVCASYAMPDVTGMVGPSELSALSGIAVSRSQPEIVFAHNDHDRPVVYALDLQGQLHARLTLEAAEAQDIEDIAVGKCDTNTCVYLADVGDNAAQRDEYGILRFVEPTVPTAAGNQQLTPSFEHLRFRYEDGSHNAESLMVAPNGNLYIVTKLAPGSGGNVAATGPSSVYRIDASAFQQSGVAQATKVATLSVPKSGEPALSAAAAHPCGLGFVARTYDRVYEYLVPAGAADFEAAFAVTPKVVAMPDEPQSEGIDYRADGRGFVTSGEGMSAPLVLTQCAP
jgi:hypothetical protein